MKNLLLFSLFFSLPTHSWAEAEEEIDLNEVLRCDESFCPSGEFSEAAVETGAGIQVPREVFRESIPVQVISSTTTIAGPSSSPVTQSIDSQDLDRANDIEQSTESDSQQQSARSTQSVSKNGESAQRASVPVTSGTSRVSGGYIFSDENPGGSPSSQKVARSPRGGSSHTSPTIDSPKIGPTSAIELNRQQMDQGGSTQEDSEKGKAALYRASVATGQGSASSTANNASQGADGSAHEGKEKKGFLEGVAEMFGLDKFWGASPDNNGQPAKNIFNGHNSKARGKASQPTGFEIERDSLQKAYLNARGLATPPEFASRRANLFGLVCERYESYAHQQRIPNDYGQCPK